MGAHKKLVIVFDLDQTIGYFTQFAIIHGRIGVIY